MLAVQEFWGKEKNFTFNIRYSMMLVKQLTAAALLLHSIHYQM